MKDNQKDQIRQLQRIINSSKKIVFLGGAGVSTESGIPDFRSSRNGSNAENIPPEIALSIGFFEHYPKKFFDYYFRNLVHPDAKPNAAHYKLAELEKAGKLTHIITQNVDGLHEKAGSKKVINIHGSIHSNHCRCCHKKYTLQQIQSMDSIPICTDCGAIIKPDVVLYGENLSALKLVQADRALKDADTLIVAGTSLVVQPAANLIFSFKGKNIVLINKTPTPLDYMATLNINASIGEVLDQIKIRKNRIANIDIARYISGNKHDHYSNDGR